MPDVTMSAEQWLDAFASRVGVAAPSQEEREAILSLAGVAAHASERSAAPIACWIAARAQMGAMDARDLARELSVAPLE